MGITIPPELAHVASLVGASAELFAWDEDNLHAVADHVAAFAGGTVPSLADAESAAQRFMDSTAGAAADAFGGHWTGAASGGDAGDFTRTALTGATVMAVAAGAIKIIKVGVIGRLAWCARNLAAAALPGAGALRAAQAVGMARTSIRALVDRLLKHLRERVAPAIQRANDNFRDILQGPRPAFAGVPAPRRSPLRAGSPTSPKNNQAFMAKKDGKASGGGSGSKRPTSAADRQRADHQADLLAERMRQQESLANSAKEFGLPYAHVQKLKDAAEEFRQKAIALRKIARGED
ncbi:hypothetical protein [Streptosporangium sp. NBC_01756]|uniref:hypothetical protein n=1 Tax=Streptosporangium sp. NBC_01756 TaxID=2975950 RepID=UPI002DDB768E|nr:hypothetical protein [Streptosporangium sp. NBC_01756]WSC85514.1 hypothetical protein OIE48_34950 [Streptosporangium sp. NBC_01756]